MYTRLNILRRIERKVLLYRLTVVSPLIDVRAPRPRSQLNSVTCSDGVTREEVNYRCKSSLEQ